MVFWVRKAGSELVVGTLREDREGVGLRRIDDDILILRIRVSNVLRFRVLTEETRRRAGGFVIVFRLGYYGFFFSYNALVVLFFGK